MKNNHIVKLKNGIRVVASPLKERKSVSVGIWVHVGGRDESERLSGVSHFLEHLVFKGTKKRTANQIKESVEGVGGSLNAFTSEEYTCFLAKCSDRHFDGVFDVLADMVTDATLRDEDIEKERTVILEEIKMTQDQPSEIADELLASQVWSGHALGRPIAGTLKSVSNIQASEIRQYRDSYYDPGLITVVAAGSIEADRLVRAVEEAFAQKRKQQVGKSYQLFRQKQRKPQYRFLNKKTEQTHLSIGLHAFRRDHPDEAALDILHILLGGNMSSRLFNEVREERGLAYEIGTFLRKYKETGAFGVSAGVDNAKAAEAAQVIIAELNKILTALVPEDEMSRAKEFYLGQLDLGLESTMNQMLWIGEGVVSLGRIRSHEEVKKAVSKVTPDRIQKVAKDLFKTHQMTFAAVGPKADTLEKTFKKLSFVS